MEFKAWGKTPRLFRDIIITEKIDGTNAAIIITEDGEVGAQSRKRLITVEDDNYGFARWVSINRAFLKETLGPGYHYGEWWGQKIQRGYGVSRKYFSLFNVHRWSELNEHTEAQDIGLKTVPLAYRGVFGHDVILDVQQHFIEHGSLAAPGFMPVEGIIIYHLDAGKGFKYTFDGDGHKDAPES